MSPGTPNAATVRRLYDAVNSGDTDLIFATLDEITEPGMRLRTSAAAAGTGTDALK